MLPLTMVAVFQYTVTYFLWCIWSSTVGYLIFEFKDRSVCCSFVMAKSRLAPIKTLTMPRLELNAAIIGVKLFNLIIHEIDLSIEKVKFWSDSMLTLQYIHDHLTDLKFVWQTKYLRYLKGPQAMTGTL